jgi:hypothetical protein
MVEVPSGTPAKVTLAEERQEKDTAQAVEIASYGLSFNDSAI